MAKVTASKILELAKKEIGVKATNIKRCKYNKAFYDSDVSGSAYDWCAVFIWWLFKQVGATDLLYVKTAGCGVLGNAFYTRNKFKTSGYKPGDIVFFHWSNNKSSSVPITYSLDHVGIIEKCNGDGTYTTIEGNTGSTSNGEVMRRIRSASVISGVCRPDYTTESSSSSSSTSKKESSKNTTNIPNAIYKVKTNGKWLPEVKNLTDYAGIVGKAITDVAIKFSKGTCKYRVHVKGSGWLPYVTGYSTSDHNNGYAGNGKPIDAIEVYYNTPSDIVKSGYLKAKYRVSPINGNYYSYQYDNKTGNNQDGYAGSFGKTIDRFQLILSK